MNQDKREIGIGVYRCLLGHTWEYKAGGRMSPFESKPCPICQSASGLETVKYVSVNK